MTIQYLSSKRIQGLSSDTKPTNVPNNTEFIETDTGSVYKVTSGTWSIFKSAMPKGDFYYFIYYSGTQYEALNGKTGVIDYTNTTDFANVLNSAITAVSTAGGGLIHLSNGTLLTRSIIIPKNNVRIEGQGESTIIKQDATQNLAAMFKGLNFDTLTGGGTNGGVESFYMSYLVIDGNKSNNVTTATDGIIFYGYNWKFDHVHIRHMRGRGIYSEWQSAGGLVPNSLTSMEAHYSHLKIHDCETIGWVNRGPHDWEGEHITIYDCGSHGYVQEYSAGVYSGSGYVDNMHIFACDGIYAAWIKGGTLHYANLTTETSGNGTPGAGGIGLYVDGGAVYGTGLWCYAEDRGVVFNTGGFCVCEASHIENCYDSGVEISKNDVIFDGYVANNGEKGIIVGTASVAIANVRITGTSMGHTQAQVDWANAGNSSVAGFLSIYTNSTNTVGILNENNINIDTNSLTYENQADGTAVRAFDGRPMTARTTAKSPFSRKFGQLFAGHSATVTQGLYMGVTETGTKTYVNDQWWGIVINYNTGTTANSRSGINGGTTTPTLFTRTSDPYKRSHIKIPTTSSSRFYGGFGSYALVPVTDTVFGSSDSGVMVGWRSSDTTLMVFWNDGTGAMPTATNTSITIPTNGWTYEIIANDQNTKFTVKIVTSSTTYSTTLTTRIPGASTRLATYDVLENTTTTARIFQVNAAILESKFIL